MKPPLLGCLYSLRDGALPLRILVYRRCSTASAKMFERIFSHKLELSRV